MQTVPLGKSDLMASRLAYGCWRLAGSEGVEPKSERGAFGRRAVQAAIEAGYILFDHADIYGGGECERIFGEAIKEMTGIRDSLLIASKCGICKAGVPKPESPYRYDFSAGHIIWSCEQSLKRLGVERVDLYQLHRPDFLSDPEEVAQAFARLHQAGKVREFGVSNFRPTQLAALQKACPFPLVVNQVEISLSHLACFQDGTLDQCLAERITPMAWSPLAGGKLAANEPIDLRDPHHAQRLHIREELDLIARDRQAPRATVSLAWLLKHPSRIIPIVGSTDPVRIKDLTRAADLELTRDEWYRLFEAGLGQRLP